jgi:hypothetical protein
MDSFDYTSCNEEFDIEEEDDVGMFLLMHKNKRPKHGGSIFGCESIRKLRTHADYKLMINYFVHDLVFPER